MIKMYKTKKINITYEKCTENFVNSLIIVLKKTKKIRIGFIRIFLL
jgi:hypothetical protein